MSRKPRKHELFDKELRRWGARPPETSAEVVAERLRARLREERTRRPRGWWRALPTAAAAGLAVLAVLLRFGAPFGVDSVPPGHPGGDATQWLPAPVDPGVVLIPLEDGSTLYMSLGPALGARSGTED